MAIAFEHNDQTPSDLSYSRGDGAIRDGCSTPMRRRASWGECVGRQVVDAGLPSRPFETRRLGRCELLALPLLGQTALKDVELNGHRVADLTLPVGCLV